MCILSDETHFADLARGVRAELASEATGVALMQFSGILGDIYGMEPVLRSGASSAFILHMSQ